MKNNNKLVFLFALLCLVASLTFAQGPTNVQQSAQRLDAATTVGTSATSAATITITVPANQYFYLTGIDITNCAGASAVTAAAVTTITTTNFAGTTPAWTIGSGTTAGACQPTISPTFSVPLKSATPGTNVTVVLPTFATNQTVRVNVYGYFGY